MPEDQNKVRKQTFSSLSPKYAIVKKIINEFLQIKTGNNNNNNQINSMGDDHDNKNNKNIDCTFEKFGVIISKPQAHTLPAIVSATYAKRRLRSHRKKKRQKLTDNEKDLRLKELVEIETLRNKEGYPILTFEFAKKCLTANNVTSIHTCKHLVNTTDNMAYYTYTRF